MQQQKEYPPDMNNCKDKFLVQSCVVAASTADGGTVFTPEGAGAALSAVKDGKLRVQYVSPAPPPSPVAEEAEGPGSSEKGAARSGSLPPRSPAFVAASPGLPGSAGKPGESAESLRKELAALGAAHESAKAALAEKEAKLARLGGGLVPFTLLHILLTALIAFALGRLL